MSERKEGRRRLSPVRLALLSLTVEVPFTSAGHQRLGWEGIWSEVGETDSTVPGRTESVLPEFVAARASQTQPVLAGLAWGPALAATSAAAATADASTAALGAGAGVELTPARRRAAQPSPAEQPSVELTQAWRRAQDTLAPLVASVGDRLFHAAVPACLSAGLVVLGLHFAPLYVFWYPILCGVFVFGVAVWGWEVGLRGEDAAVELLMGRKLERWAQRVEAAGRVLLGAAVGLLLASSGRAEGGSAFVVSAFGLIVLATVAWRRGLPPFLRLWLLVGMGTLLGRWLG
ncbi:MAG: hypothetical protein H6682_02545 [Candidatus Eisenbacteria bacterium]|nr:hypothetical protein [Candidatus Eisenbacteria bacterium]